MKVSTTGETRRLGYLRTAPGAPRLLDATAQRQAVAAAGPVADWHADEGVGADRPLQDRPALLTLLDRLRPGDVLGVASIDRIGRDLVDLADTLDRVHAAGAGIEVGGVPWAVDRATLNLLVLHAITVGHDAAAGEAAPLHAAEVRPFADSRR